MDEYYFGEQFAAVERGVMLRRPTDSESLFKYVGLNNKTSWRYFEETLNDSVLRGSTAKSLNDPFELEPCVVNDLSPSVIENVVGGSSLIARKTNLVRRLQRSPSDKELKEDERNRKLDFADIQKYQKLAESYLERVKTSYRIISFCQRSDSSLLWAHYANSYQGACLHFLGRAFRRSVVRIGHVQYSAFRPMFPLSLALTLELEKGKRGERNEVARKESEKLHFFTKASEWAYETEVRIAYASNVQKTVEFDRAGLASIILGPRMPEDNRNRIRELVANSPYPNLRVYTASLSKTAFSVEAFGDEEPATSSQPV